MRCVQSLSGVLKKKQKSEFRYTLQLDGMTGSMDLRGDVLGKFRAGDRVMVKGIIRTRLYNPVADGTPQQQPIHWVIFMEVREAKATRNPFGLKGG